MPAITRYRVLAILLFLSPVPAMASNVAILPANQPGSTAVPAPNSPQAIQELHALLQNAYAQGERAQQSSGAQRSQQPVLAAWVEVLRNAILSIGSAAFIAAWGFAIGMILIGIAAILFAIRRPRS